MSSGNHVASRLPQSFGSYRIAVADNVNVNTTGANVIVLPILSGGITSTGGGYIVRRITVTNQTGANAAPCNVSILTSSDGNVSNQVTGNVLLSSLSANNTWQDITLNATTNSTILTAQCLFRNVITGTSNGTGLLSFAVYGDMVQL